MTDIIIRNEIVNRVMIILPKLDDGIYSGYVFIGKKNVTGLSTCCFYMVYTILFLFGPRKFVFLYDVFFIVIQGAATHKACLASAIHYQLVDIITAFFFAEQDITLQESMQI